MRLKIGLIVIALIPIKVLRHWFYKIFYGYKINGRSEIGMLNYINCKELVLDDSKIGFLNLIIVKKLVLKNGAKILKRNRIKYLNSIEMDEKALINTGNFVGGQKLTEGELNTDFQNLFLGKKSEILRNNYFDLVRPITIGENVVFGGEGSQIWTHGFELDRTMLTGSVNFGNNIFIGSNCIFTKNVEVADNVTIGPGSVIYKSITESGMYSTHQLLKIK